MTVTKRSVQGHKTMAKGSIPGKVRVHHHTQKALNAVRIKSGIKSGSKGSTNNGLTSKDDRY